MADKKITQLNNITGANLADTDEFVVVDISADETMAVTRAEFFKNTPLINNLTVGRGLGDVPTNTALGFSALSSNTTGNSNTATGLQTLFSNTTGANNSAFGV